MIPRIVTTANSSMSEKPVRFDTFEQTMGTLHPEVTDSDQIS